MTLGKRLMPRLAALSLHTHEFADLPWVEKQEIMMIIHSGTRNIMTQVCAVGKGC